MQRGERGVWNIPFKTTSESARKVSKKQRKKGRSRKKKLEKEIKRERERERERDLDPEEILLIHMSTTFSATNSKVTYTLVLRCPFFSHSITFFFLSLSLSFWRLFQYASFKNNSNSPWIHLSRNKSTETVEHQLLLLSISNRRKNEFNITRQTFWSNKKNSSLPPLHFILFSQLKVVQA